MRTKQQPGVKRLSQAGKEKPKPKRREKVGIKAVWAGVPAVRKSQLTSQVAKLLERERSRLQEQEGEVSDEYPSQN